MLSCPYCRKKIDNLIHRIVTHQEVTQRFKSILVPEEKAIEDVEGSRTEVLTDTPEYLDTAAESWKCPECGKDIATSYAEALDFLMSDIESRSLYEAKNRVKRSEIVLNCLYDLHLCASSLLCCYKRAPELNDEISIENIIPKDLDDWLTDIGNTIRRVEEYHDELEKAIKKSSTQNSKEIDGYRYDLDHLIGRRVKAIWFPDTTWYEGVVFVNDEGFHELRCPELNNQDLVGYIENSYDHVIVTA